MIRVIILFIGIVISHFAFAQHKLVEINGGNIEVEILGAGSPTVIFECGLAMNYSYWGTIPDSITQSTQVLLYNRAGIGKSDIVSDKREIPTMINELKQVLEEENIQGPFIMVGQSMGGYLVRYFSNKYPNDVAGVLMIDPASEEVYDNMNREYLEDFVFRFSNNFARASLGERLEWNYYLKNREFVRGVYVPENIPVTMLSASQFNWYKYHKTMIANTKNTRHLLIESSHEMHKDKPEVVISEIRELIKRVQKNK